jgi:ribosome-associated translation inhibitor RaiA
MEAIEAVLELAKDRDHIADELETYEDWFESLVGHHVTLSVKSKKSTRFVDCLVTEFVDGEGWELQSQEDDDDTVYVITFDDFVKGRVQVHA